MQDRLGNVSFHEDAFYKTDPSCYHLQWKTQKADLTELWTTVLRLFSGLISWAASRPNYQDSNLDGRLKNPIKIIQNLSSAHVVFVIELYYLSLFHS